MMFAQRFRQMAKQIPAEWLPFADVASVGLPLPRLLRLSLFKVTMGMTTALLIGTLNRVMVLGWDFEYNDDRTGRVRKTVTSVDLLREATYPVSMHEIIDNKVSRNESAVNNLFVMRDKKYVPQVRPRTDNDEVYFSRVLALKNGYGFIDWPPNNLYFHYTWLIDSDFNDLDEGDRIEFKIGQNDKDQDVAIDVRKVTEFE